MTLITTAMVKELRERTGAAMMACKNALNEAKGDMEKAIDLLRKAGELKAAKRAGKTAAEGGISVAVDSSKKHGVAVEINCETDFVGRDANFQAFAETVAKRALEESVKDVGPLGDLPYSKGSLETIDAARKALINKMGENIQIRRLASLTAKGMMAHYIHGQRIGVLVALDQVDPELGKDVAMHIAAANPQSLSADDVPQSVIDREREIYLEQAKGSGKPAEIIEKMVAGKISKFLKENSLLGQVFIKDPNVVVGDLLKSKKNKVTAFVRFEVGEGIEKEKSNFANEVMAQVQGNNG